MANKYVKRHTIFLVIRKMQIKITVRYHFAPPSMAIIKKTDNNKCYKNVKRLEPSHITGENVKWYSCFGKQFDSSTKS